MSSQGNLIICLHRGTSLISRIVRWFTHSDYSHASFILPDGRHVEAREGRGVVVHPEFTQRTDEAAVDRFELGEPLTEAQLAALLIFVASTEGAPYDYWMIGSFIWGGGPRRASQKAWFCSEHVYAALQVSGHRLLRIAEAWRVAPGDIWLSPAIREVSSDPDARRGIPPATQ